MTIKISPEKRIRDALVPPYRMLLNCVICGNFTRATFVGGNTIHVYEDDKVLAALLDKLGFEIIMK